MSLKSLDRLVAAFKRMPGIGPKQAQRMAIHLFRAPVSEAQNLVEALREARARIRPCRECFDFTDAELCAACADTSRDQGLLCVVSEPQDVTAIERSRGYQGLYHVLHGCLSPLDGVGPESLRISELVERIGRMGGSLREVILATDADTEGEATALYLARLLKPNSIRITRIAQGIPMGGGIEYIDERTLTCALAGRREV